MKLITLQEPTSFQINRSTGTFKVNFQANLPYLVSNANFASLYEGMKSVLYKVSLYDTRVENFNVNASRKSAPVLYFNGSGGFGDQVMSWPVAHILHKLGYQVHVMTELGLETCWWNFPWIRSVVSTPIAQGQVELYEHKAWLDSVVNFDEHDDQGHPIDVQLKKFGIDPDTVGPEHKVLPPIFSPGELAKADDVAKGIAKLGIYQLAPTSPTRAVGVDQTIMLLSELARRFTDVTWIALHDEFSDSDMVDRARSIVLPNVRLAKFVELRVLWAVIRKAAICVGPDSMVAHVAGSMAVPCVGLWGPINPANRIRYYKNHIPIWHATACQFAPCFVSTHEFPKFCPPTPGPRKICTVLGKISPDEVGDAVAKLLV